MFKSYIKNLFENIQKPKEPQQIDIVLEGGSNNGYYELGILLFLKELEKENYIQVNRISGASIGSYMGYHYFNDSLEETTKIFKVMKNHFERNLNIFVFKDLLKNDFKKIKDETFIKIKENKFFTSFVDVNEKKVIVNSNYKSKEELEECIFKSCYIPYVCGKNLTYKDKYVDGIVPHIFNNRSKNSKVKILYVSINQFDKIKNMFRAKENNMNGRILEGIVDCYKFFYDEKPTYFCSFVNDWSFISFSYLRCKQYCILITFYLLYYCIICSKMLYPFIKDYKAISFLIPVLRNFYKDTMLYLCFN